VKLDVGCGYFKRGDIGIDVRPTPCVDVLASAEALPFRDQSFDQVVSYECIGYDTGPEDELLALLEALRVTRTIVRLYTWNEPAFLGKLRIVPHTITYGAYVPTFLRDSKLQEDSDFTIIDDFFCKFEFSREVLEWIHKHFFRK